jgi:SUMO ligase MMS21 Smc5/6 complex component
MECPITHQPITHPVIGPDSITYEKDAIEAWLREHGMYIYFISIAMRITK